MCDIATLFHSRENFVPGIDGLLRNGIATDVLGTVLIRKMDWVIQFGWWIFKSSVLHCENSVLKISLIDISAQIC